jgi:ribonucleoside-triphosphate reductase
LAFELVKQALQECLFTINVPTRVVFQILFTIITLDLLCPKHVAEESVIIGSRIMEDKYRDFQPEIDIFNRAPSEITTEGDTLGRIMTFPIPTINLTKDFDEDNPNLNGPREMTNMACRLFLIL